MTIERTDELATRICELIADGESLVDICKMPGMPSRSTVLRWLDDDPEFDARYERAREAQGDFMDHKILETANTCKTAEDAQVARVKIGAYQWRAEKLKPRRYGNKLDVTSNGETVAKDPTALAVQVASLLALGAERAVAGSD